MAKYDHTASNYESFCSMQPTVNQIMVDYLPKFNQHTGMAHNKFCAF